MSRSAKCSVPSVFSSFFFGNVYVSVWMFRCNKRRRPHGGFLAVVVRFHSKFERMSIFLNVGTTIYLCKIFFRFCWMNTHCCRIVSHCLEYSNDFDATDDNIWLFMFTLMILFVFVKFVNVAFQFYSLLFELFQILFEIRFIMFIRWMMFVENLCTCGHTADGSVSFCSYFNSICKRLRQIEVENAMKPKK